MLWKSLTALAWVVLGCVYLCSEPAHSSSAGYVFQSGPYIYKVVLPKYDRRSWYEAEEICRLEENGNLLTIGDKREGRWVNQLVQNLTKEMDYLGKFWIGATDRRLRGVYEFIDGSPFRFREAPWAKGEPNRPPKKTFGFEYCISMDPNSGTPTWSDEDCFQSFGYICKSREVPKRLKDNRRFGYAWEWNYYEYKFIPLPYDSMTWSEAELYCQEAESGHLLSIYNSEESEWVTERIKQIRQVLGFKGLWIGATDIFSRGAFKWTDRGPVNYTKWTQGAPKNTSLSRKPREACVAILADRDWGKWDEEFCINKMPFVCKTKKCKGKSDLAFIVDASGSVTPEGFQKAKEFMLKVMQGFQVTNNETHVGLIRFANDADIIFGLKKHHNILELKKAIDDMLFVQGETHTEKALDLARTTLFSHRAGSRLDVPRIALVMTDGKSASFRHTTQAAAKLKAMGVTIVTVGIGNGVDRKELIDMSTSKDYVLYVESYAALSKRVKEIRERVCDEIIRQGLIRQRALEEKARILAELRARERARILAQENARRLALQRLSAKERARQLAEQRRLQQERARKLAQQQRLDKENARKLAEKQRLERERKLAEQRRRENQRRQNNRNIQNRNNQNRNTQNRNTQNRNTQNRNTQNRNIQNRNTQNRNTQNRNIQNRNTQNRNTQNRNNQNRNTQNRNIQNRNNQNRNTQNRNTQNRNNQNRNTQNRNTQNRNTQNRNTQNRNLQNRNQYNRNTQNRNTQNRNTQNRNIQNRNQYNRNTQNRNQYNRNTQNRNQYNRNTQNRNQYNRNTQNRNQYNRNTQNRNVQNRNQYNRNQYNRNTQNRNTQNRNTQNRNTQNRNTQNRYQYNRNTQNRNTQNRNFQNRNTQNRNTQNRYQYNRNTQNRNAQNRNTQYNRNQYNRNRNAQSQYNRNQG